jgi:hypothetical protein
VKAQSKEEEIENLDVVELLARSCGVGERAPGSDDTATAAE